jgi:hypothetical protein
MPGRDGKVTLLFVIDGPATDMGGNVEATLTSATVP